MSDHLIWHPYTQEKTATPNICIERAEGAYLYDKNGERYIDAVASWWTNTHGHAHPYIAQKIATQALQLEHIIFAGFTHEPAMDLALKLMQLLPDFSKVMYTDNGSSAVEVAIKMAIQFWDNKQQQKPKIICFRDAYHGDTFGAMSVSARGVFTKPYQPLLFDVLFIDTPVSCCEKIALNQLENHLHNHANEIAAFIFEPLVLGSGGMLMYTPEILDNLISLCKEKNILILADEVMTGFGRTGKLFATNYLKNKVDIICLSKGLTGGFLPFAATLCTQKIYDAFYDEDKTKMLFHGHSYAGNPLGCAAALASLELFAKEKTLEKIEKIAIKHAEFLHKIKPHANVLSVRQTGTILALEIKGKDENGYLHSIRDRMYNFFIERKILLRPLGNVLYILPPYCISAADLDEIYEAIIDFLDIV